MLIELYFTVTDSQVFGSPKSKSSNSRTESG